MGLLIREAVEVDGTLGQLRERRLVLRIDVLLQRIACPRVLQAVGDILALEPKYLVYNNSLPKVPLVFGERLNLHGSETCSGEEQDWELSVSS